MSYPLQSHFHIGLDTTGDNGAPTYKWVSTVRVYSPSVIASPKRTLNGTLFVSALRNVSGDPLIFDEFKYSVKVKPEGSETVDDRIQLLKGLLMKRIKFVDHYHPDDGEDHTPAVRDAVLTAMNIQTPPNPTNVYLIVDIVVTVEAGI